MDAHSRFSPLLRHGILPPFSIFLPTLTFTPNVYGPMRAFPPPLIGSCASPLPESLPFTFFFSFSFFDRVCLKSAPPFLILFFSSFSYSSGDFASG